MSEFELWNELGNLYFLAGSYGNALHAYGKAIDLHPDVGEPHANLALTYVQMGRYSEASDAYQRGIPLLKDELDKAVSLHKLGSVFLQLKQYPRAAETYQKMEELVPDLGRIVEASRSSDLLLHCPPSGVGLQPVGSGDVVFPLASFDGKELPFAEELTPWWFDGQIVPEYDTDPDFSFINTAGVQDETGDIVFTESLTWAPGITDPVNGADKDEQTGMIVDSQSADSTGPNVNHSNSPETADVQDPTKFADVPAITNPEPAAVQVITDAPEVLTAAPEFSAQTVTDVDAVQYKTPVEWPVVELSQEERLEIQAHIKKFRRVLELNPRNAFAWDTLGGYYKSLGQYDDAIDAFQKAVSLDSSKAFYFHHLGLVYAAVGRHEEAINAFERVIQVDPHHSLAHATLGGYYRKNGNEELAMAHIEQARNLLAADENEYNRACMEAICGNTDRSLELLELALKNKQTYVNWARKDPDLDFIRNDPRFHDLLAGYAARTV